jgi:hypothetical protein
MIKLSLTKQISIIVVTITNFTIRKKNLIQLSASRQLVPTCDTSERAASNFDLTSLDMDKDGIPIQTAVASARSHYMKQ